MTTSWWEMFKGTSPQLLAVVTGTINAVSDGMQFGWTSPTIPLLHRNDTQLAITHSDEVWLETLYLLGDFIALPFTVYAINAMGRKMTMWLASVVGLCGWICVVAATNKYVLYVARVFAGVMGDVVFTVSPIYVSEVAHQKIRGFMEGLIYLKLTIGIFVVYAIGPWFPIYATAIVGMSFISVHLIVFPFMPESPYYLVYKNKFDDAKKALKRLRVEPDVSNEFEEIMKAVERQKTEKGRLQDLFLIKSNRKAILAIIVLNIAQHFAGVSVFIMNLESILSEAGSNLLKAKITAAIFPFLMLVGAIIATLIIDECGRRRLLVISGFLTTLFLLILSIYFHLKYLGYQTKQYNWAPFVFVMIYAASASFGLGIVPIVLTAEVLPAKVKAMGTATGDISYVAGSLLSICCYQWWIQQFGIHITFYIFTLICGLSSLLMYCCVTETKGNTLEEIQMILKNQIPLKNEANIIS